MFVILAPSLVSFCVFYFTLRYLKLFWEQRKLPSWSRFVLGIFAWGALLSSLGVLWGLAQPMIGLFTKPSMGLGYLIIGLALCVGMIAKYANANPELFDFQSMKPFLKDSLFFVSPSLRWNNIFEDLDKHNVRKVYRETSGKELPEEDDKYDRQLQQKLEGTKLNAFSRDRRVAAPKWAKDLVAQTIASPHLKTELEQLQQGATVDISDSWKINSLKRSPHDYFKLVSTAIVDPSTMVLDLHLQSEEFAPDRAKDPVKLFQLKQQVYELFQAIHQEKWVQPYLNGIETFRCTCAHYEDEAFVGPRTHPVCRFEISRTELKAHEQTYFNAGEMKTEVLQ